MVVYFHINVFNYVIQMCDIQIRNHLIQRFLEDPLISLSTIKDDDHLVAYKTMKLLKSTKYFQLMHRHREQYVYLILMCMYIIIRTLAGSP